MARDARSPDDLFATKRSGAFADYNPLRCYYVGLGGKIYAVGGQFGNDQGLTTQKYVHVWDPANPSVWTRVADMPISSANSSSVGSRASCTTTVRLSCSSPSSRP